MRYIHIPVDNGQVEFYYGGLSYRIPEKVHFQSKLEGLETEWQLVGTRHEAFYRNLDPGKYIFHVTACNSDGVWNETGASFAFELEPRFYQTYWFYGFVFITLSGTAFGVYRLRVRQLLERKNELERYVLERKKAEDALAEERNLLRTLIDNMPDRIYAKDTESRFIVCNKALATRMGMSNPDEIVGKSDFDFVAHELAARFRADELAIMQSGQPLINREEPMDSVTGTTRWNLATKVPLHDNRGNIIGIVGMGREITDRKQAEKALQESEKRFKEMFDDAPVGYHELDAEGRFTRVNRTELQMLGYTAEEMIGQYVWKFVTDGEFSKQRVMAKLSGTIPPSQDAERYFVRKDLTRIPVLTEDRLLRDAHGKITGIRTILQNITELRKAEEARKESEERYWRLVEFSPDAIAVHSEGVFVYVNPAAVKLIGANSAAELINKPVLDIIHPDYRESARQQIATGIKQNKVLPLLEEKFLRLDGGILDVELTSLPIVVGGKPATQIVVKDITEQKKLRQELLQSQKMQSIGTLAGGIAHDFNNILNIILGYTTLLYKYKSDDLKFSESTTAISQTVQRGAALVRQILTFARKTDVSVEPINLIDLVHELVTMLKQTFPKIIAFKEDFPKDIPYIHADHIQVHQAILNLCVNARDAMPNGGTITIKVENQLKEQVLEQIPMANQDSYVCISVTDTGEGMDEATRLRVFDPFFTTKPLGKGTGMGLSVVYGAIQAHHGYVHVESEIGHGTTFRLYFPVQLIGERTVDSQQSIESFEIGGTETILLVENEEFLSDLVHLMLESKGYKVLSAKDGIEALELFTSHKQEINLVFSDMGLPGLAGIDEFKKLKEIDPNVRVIFASGFFEPDIKSELFKAGVKGFIQKPYLTDEILRTLRKVLDEKDA